MNLYLICHVDNDGDTNMDLLLRVATPEEAVDLWRDHFKDWFLEGETPLPDHVFQVPADGNGVLNWHVDVRAIVTRYHAVEAAKEALEL